MKQNTFITTEKDFVARESYPFLIISLLLSLGLYYLIHPFLGWLGFLFFLFCIYFFRNPKRYPTQEPGVLIVPADGTVIFIGDAEEPHFLKKKMQRVTVFMSPFNVHVNRSPASGVVKACQHFCGKFLKAYDANAGLQNERSAIHLLSTEGDDLVFVQVAGWFARRIVSYPQVDDQLGRGQIFGLIKFGSRMDIYFPAEFKVAVQMKQKVKAGETVLAKK